MTGILIPVEYPVNVAEVAVLDTGVAETPFTL
jgi:hypothetical protein